MSYQYHFPCASEIIRRLSTVTDDGEDTRLLYEAFAHFVEHRYYSATSVVADWWRVMYELSTMSNVRPFALREFITANFEAIMLALFCDAPGFAAIVRYWQDVMVSEVAP